VQGGELQLTGASLPGGDVIVSPYAILNGSSNTLNGGRNITIGHMGTLTSGSNTLGGILTLNNGNVSFTNATLTLNNAGAGLAFNGGLIRGTNASANETLRIYTDVSYASISTAQALFVGYSPSTEASSSGLRLVVELGSDVRTFTVDDASANRPAASSDMAIHAVVTSGADGGLIKAGTGTLEFQTAMSYTGSTTITDGNLLLTGGTSAISKASTTTGTTAGNNFQGGIDVGDVTGLVLGQTIAGVDGGGAYPAGTYIRAIRADTNRIWLSAAASEALSGSSTINFADAYTLNNDSDIALNGGFLTLATAYALDPAGPANLTFGGGTLKYGAGVTTDVSGRFAAVASGENVRIDTNDNYVTFASTISGDGGLVKTGDGVLALDMANLYLGQTTIEAGTLGGSGSIAGAVAIASGAALAPGNSPGSMEVASLDLQDGATLTIELAGTMFTLNVVEEYDRIKVSGDTTLAGLLDVVLADGFNLQANQLFGVVDTGGVLTGAFSNFAEGDTVLSDNGFNLVITYAGMVTDGTVGLAGGNDVVFYSSAIPEPATLALLVVSGLVMQRRTRRQGNRG
jgi:autotransporter-associated beta strand protein